MGRRLFVGLSFLFLTACASQPALNGQNLPKFSYVDSVRTVKKVNCRNRVPEDCMACALQGEAANQPARGIYAVGVTIMTRAKANPKRICRVTKARRQFEAVPKKRKRRISKKVMKVTEHIMSSRETGWTHYWAPKTQYRLKRRKPAWAHVFEKRQCKSKKIGSHIFYNIKSCKFDRRMRINAQN